MSSMYFLTVHQLPVTRHISPRNAPLQKPRGTVFVHRSQLMTLGTFQAVKFGGSKGGPGASAASRGGSGCHGASWGGSGVPGVGGR